MKDYSQFINPHQKISDLEVEIEKLDAEIARLKSKYRVIECLVCRHCNIFPTALFRREPFPISDFVKQKYCKHMMIGHDGIRCIKETLAKYPFKKVIK